MSVDGSIEEWSRLERVGDGPAVGAVNDGTTLYLAIASNDVMVRQQLATGLIVWLDGTARKAQTFGLRLEGLTRRPLPGAAPDASPSEILGRDRALNVLEDVDLLGPGKNQRRLIENPAAVGMSLAAGVESGMMVYELRLPLERTNSTPHAVGAKPGGTFSLGLETPPDAGPRARNRLENPTSSYPYVIDPYGGFFGPPPPPRNGSAPKEIVIKPMKLLWATVKLARP